MRGEEDNDVLKGRAVLDILYGDVGIDSLNGGEENHQDKGDLSKNDPMDLSIEYCTLLSH